MNMISESNLVKNLNEYLHVDEIKDDTVNGIQVDAPGPIKKIAFAVDARRDVIGEALKLRANLLVTHHGMIWNGIKRVVGKNYSLLSMLIKNDMAIYTSHLPLDIHPEIGNNVMMARLLDAEITDTFMDYKGTEVVLMAELPKPKKVSDIARSISDSLDIEPLVCFGDKSAEQIAIMTGKGGSALSQAYLEGADLLITGERTYMTYNESIDLEMPAIFAGHYATETSGIQRLMEKVEEEYDHECVWIDGFSEV